MESGQNAHGTVAATYDAAGRLKTATAQGQTTTFGYVGSLLESRTDAAGTTTYEYETDTGRVHEIAGPFGGFVTRFEYKPSGRLRHTWENVDLRTTYGYDTAGRVKTKTTTEDPDTDDDDQTDEYAAFSTEYNADSQVIERTTAIQDGTLSGPDNGTWSYSYDPIGRLRTATDPDGVFFEYDYDGAGNRTLVKETRNDNDIERVTSAITDYEGAQPKKSTTTVTVEGVTTPPVETTYSHDDRGNLTRIDGPGAWRSFSYDHWGRLRTAQNGAPDEAAVAKHVYFYDGLDRTLGKASSSVTAGVETAVARELYRHAGLGHELVQTSRQGPEGADADTLLTSYAYRGGVPYAVQRTSGESLLEGESLDSGLPDVQTTLLGTNPHGDVVYAMSRDHALQSITSYDPWGAVRSQVGDDGMLGFQSDPTDPDTGLVDMESRNYLPEMGRFLTRDTYAGETTDPLSMNRYAYGGGDPVSTIDPDGHKEMLCPRGQTCDSNEELERMRDASQEIAQTRTSAYATQREEPYNPLWWTLDWRNWYRPIYGPETPPDDIIRHRGLLGLLGFDLNDRGPGVLDAIGYDLAQREEAAGATLWACAEKVTCVEDSGLNPVLPGSEAITIGRTIFFRGVGTECLRAHELAHVWQVEVYGERAFLDKYSEELFSQGWMHLQDAYHGISFEEVAYRVQAACEAAA